MLTKIDNIEGIKVVYELIVEEGCPKRIGIKVSIFTPDENGFLVLPNLKKPVFFWWFDLIPIWGNPCNDTIPKGYKYRYVYIPIGVYCMKTINKVEELIESQRKKFIDAIESSDQEALKNKILEMGFRDM